MMKKFTLLSLILAFSFGMFAQVKADKQLMVQKANKENVSIDVVKYDKYEDYQQARAFGDTIVYDDFSSGSNGVLPTGWTSVDYDSQGNNYTWKWTDVGATGSTTTGYEHVLASTTAANGWIILDSDLNGQGSYDSYLYSPSYDCSNFNAVAISFEELYKRWGNETTNPYGGNPTYLGVSIDNGNTWTEIEIHGDFAAKDETDNPGYYMYNISSIAGSQSNVKIYFRMQGLWDYWWQIDDFMLIEGPRNNLKITETRTSAAIEDSPGVYYELSYYSLMPLAHVTPMQFTGTVTNNGVDVQHAVTLTCDVTKDGTNVYTQTDDTVQMAFLDTTKLTPSVFSATSVGTYEVNYVVSQTEVEEVPADNVAGPLAWKVTNNKIMAHDYIYTTAISPQLFTGGQPGDMLGLDYFIAVDDTVKSISVFIDYRTTPGTLLLGQVNEGSSGTWLPQILTDEYEITEQDLGTWITLPVISVLPDDNIVNGNEIYMIGFEFYWSGDERVWIGGDDAGPHFYQRICNLRLGTTNYWVATLPMIRLNLNNAIEPPVFMPATPSGPAPALISICQKQTLNAVYEMDFKVEDPSGLPVTIDTVKVPDFVTSFTDNGNNTYTLGFNLTGVDTSSLMTYNFELIADNGYAQNTLFFNAKVEIITGCEPWTVGINEDMLSYVNIYPNPSTGTINVENASNATIKVYDILGKEVASIEKASNNARIDLNKFAEGTYIVRVISNNNVVSKKINLIK